MNNIIAIVLLALLSVLLLFLILRAFPASSKVLKKIVSAVSIVVILCAIFYLVRFLIVNHAFGNPGQVVDDLDDSSSEYFEDVDAGKLENCIILKYDQIIIDNNQVDMEFVQNYVDERILNNITIVIVDDYSLASLYHEVMRICKNAKVEPLKYEQWKES